MTCCWRDSSCRRQSVLWYKVRSYPAGLLARGSPTKDALHLLVWARAMRAPILHHPACCRGRSRALTCPSNITLVVSGQTVRPSAGTHAACARWSHLHWAPAPLSTHAADCHGWLRMLASASSALFANAKSAQPRRRAPRLSPLDATDTSHVEPAAWRMHRYRSLRDHLLRPAPSPTPHPCRQGTSIGERFPHRQTDSALCGVLVTRSVRV